MKFVDLPQAEEQNDGCKEKAEDFALSRLLVRSWYGGSDGRDVRVLRLFRECGGVFSRSSNFQVCGSHFLTEGSFFFAHADWNGFCVPIPRLPIVVDVIKKNRIGKAAVRMICGHSARRRASPRR